MKLRELFAGGAEAWLPRLKPILESDPEKAALIIGPNRSNSVVPGRPLMFQALKARPISQWNVIVFGQNPYPRIKSATGIAMFDNEFSTWNDSRFGKVVSMRTIAKAALRWKSNVPPSTTTAEIRSAFKKMKIVEPPDWFAAMLSQGVLLLNASLTINTTDPIPAGDPAAGFTATTHEKFWQPVVQEIVRSILEEKTRVAQETGQPAGVVFCWWGTRAVVLKKKFVDPIVKKFQQVDVRHLEHSNPAAQGDTFCNMGSVFGDINECLNELGITEVNWLPDQQWWSKQTKQAGHEAAKMSEFIASTRELHQQFLDRISDLAADIGLKEMSSVVDILTRPAQDFKTATAKIAKKMNIDEAYDFATKKTSGASSSSSSSTLGLEEIASIHLYTSGSNFYKELNETLRNSNRKMLLPYYGYLQIFLIALSKLRMSEQAKPPGEIFRGIAADLRKDFKLHSTVVWWGASSCSASQSVAQNFSGGGQISMRFRIQSHSAVGISRFSAFSSEEEYLLPPGSQLKVNSVAKEGNLVTVVLHELDSPPLIS